MRHSRALVIVSFVVLLLGAPPPALSWSGASGVHSTIALFQSHVHPDIPFDEFAAGHLGIIQPTWRNSYLYVAYRYLVGPGFDADEQKALVSYWNEGLGVQLPAPVSQWVNAGNGVDNRIAIKLGEASAAWIAKRNLVPGVEKISTIDVYRSAATGAVMYYDNCYDSAFLTAAHTLDTMIKKFGLSSPQVSQWTDAQDQVFANCSDPSFVSDPDAWFKAVNEWSHARQQVPGVPPMPSFTGSCPSEKFTTAATALNAMISKLGAANPEVTQSVSAQDQALAECSHQPAAAPPPGARIPPPLESGKQLEVAQRNYQIASAYFYSGNFDRAAAMFGEIAADGASPWRPIAPYLVARATIRKATLSGDKNDHALLARAEAQLNDIIATSSDDTVKGYARRLLGFVDAQLHPQQRKEELAHAVMLRSSGEVLRQNVNDYLWLLANGAATNSPPSEPMTDWIATFSGFAQGNPDTASLLAHSLDEWHRSSSLPWLVAVLSTIPPSDPNVPALLEAAAKVEPSSPTFVTVTYQTARLLIGQDKTDQARAKLDAMLGRRDQLPRSTVNQILALRMTTARNLTELLADAPRTALGITDDADSDELPSQLEDQPLKDLAAGPLFDSDGAAILTRWLPLSDLTQAANSPALPLRLRNQVALAAFIRAILLDNGATARNLAPVVAQAFPTLKPSIDAWLVAQGPAAQRFAAAFMMLKNPGLRFYMDPGPGRITPLDQIDSLRDNWWPSGVEQTNLQAQNYPKFLSADEKKSATEEWQKLSTINAPNFLCSEAIDQAIAHPNDDRPPEALYRCLRAVHLGCSNSQSTALAHSAFVRLHRRYSKSEWAEKGKLWYKGAGECASPN